MPTCRMSPRIFVVLSLFAALPAFAAGFALENQSARATGMGNAFAGVVDDPSAVFYNPAGLVNGEGLSLQLGDTLLVPMLSFTTPSGERTDANVVPSPPPHLYARYIVAPRFALGLGIFSSYGASSSWPEDWPGRFRARSSQLSTFTLNPSAAFFLHPKVKLGAGVQVVRGTVKLERDLDFVDSQGTVTLGGGAWGVGATVGGQLRIAGDYLELGASWRTGVPLTFEGRADFQNVVPELAGTLVDQGVRTSVRLPDIAYLGVSSRPVKNLRLGVDLHHVFWSQFRQLALRFDDPALNSDNVKKWRDVSSLHFGGEYALTPRAQVRAGFTFDPTPSPVSTLTPDLPDATRYKVSVGGGYAFGDLRLDAAYQLVLLQETTSTAEGFPGSYKGTAHVVALTLGYSLGGTSATEGAVW